LPRNFSLEVRFTLAAMARGGEGLYESSPVLASEAYSMTHRSPSNVPAGGTWIWLSCCVPAFRIASSTTPRVSSSGRTGRFFVRAGGDYIGRNPAAAEAAELTCDFRIVARPVGPKKDVVSKKLVFNTVVLQNRLFIDLA
jgi:hypothetical protein